MPTLPAGKCSIQQYTVNHHETIETLWIIYKHVYYSKRFIFRKTGHMHREVKTRARGIA